MTTPEPRQQTVEEMYPNASPALLKSLQANIDREREDAGLSPLDRAKREHARKRDVSNTTARMLGGHRGEPPASPHVAPTVSDTTRSMLGLPGRSVDDPTVQERQDAIREARQAELVDAARAAARERRKARRKADNE